MASLTILSSVSGRVYKRSLNPLGHGVFMSAPYRHYILLAKQDKSLPRVEPVPAFRKAR